MALKDYIQEFFRSDDADQAVAKDVRKLCKWWLETIRNLVVVCLLWYVAEKSHSLVMWLLAIVSVLAFLFYWLSSIMIWGFTPYSFPRAHPIKRIFLTILGTAISLLVFWTIYNSIFVAIDQFGAAQSH
jgi:hypothetical protein